ncbi:glycosyltransferase family 2 protein [Olleya namhaensis]|uniref:glycosyltransferase family 2 protein n=1 Tax=Olleya namhaensis TaxID=1144750 RepID=UPI00232B93B0|nr:glycosyltransferase [Olleya namhaensis]
MNNIFHSIIEFLFLIYGVSTFAIYIGIIIYSRKAIIRTKKEAAFLDINLIKGAKDLPSITLVAPAYNEGKTIVTNVRSLLSIQYPAYELIISNDGSTDDSLKQLINVFDLELISFYKGATEIECAPIKAIYKSNNPKYASLTVVDKENGGRSDAINAGIAYAKSDLVLCTDADCIIEQDALLKMVRPYLEALEEEVIASGGAIGIANDSVIINGTIKEIRLPKKLISRIQIVEYIRAFLLGRMAWGEIGGLMLVSGAFGLYPKHRLLEVGGFDKDTIGEDLELCIRLRRHMEDLKLKYKVVYIPETLCWTESPSTFKIYVSQRDRWARGLWETIFKHKALFFNKKYNNMGKYYFPYWVFFEFGAPIAELLGMVYITYLVFFVGLVWSNTVALFIAVYLAGCMFSTIAILMYSFNYSHYSKPKMIFKLLLAAYLEPFYSHPILLYAQLKGFLKKIFNIDTGWGIMTRTGFNEEETGIEVGNNSFNS